MTEANHAELKFGSGTTCVRGVTCVQPCAHRNIEKSEIGNPGNSISSVRLATLKNSKFRIPEFLQFKNCHISSVRLATRKHSTSGKAVLMMPMPVPGAACQVIFDGQWQPEIEAVFAWLQSWCTSPLRSDHHRPVPPPAADICSQQHSEQWRPALFWSSA